jgi:opacity protein-like surface antigen
MSFKRAIAFSLLVGLIAPASARADGIFVPFIGVNFAGNSGNELSNAIDANRFNWGFSLGYMGGGVLGFEADVGYSPDFYGRTDIGGSSVLTAMGNLVIGIPFGGQTGAGFRPYALAGLGVVRSKVDAFGDVLSFDNSKAGWDVGGGAMFFFGTHVGLRAEVRYFRTFSGINLIDAIERRERLDFTRASTGLILRF